jgi:N-methylhydantoinase A
VLLRSGERLDQLVESLAGDAEIAYRSETGRRPDRLRIVVDVRYLGQAHETSVVYAAGEGWDALADRFHASHQERNGFARPDDPIEVVTLRAEAIGSPAMGWSDLPAYRPEGDAYRGTRELFSAEGSVEASVWWRGGLAPDREVVGPAIIEEGEATTYLGPGERALVSESGALEVSW